MAAQKRIVVGYSEATKSTFEIKNQGQFEGFNWDAFQVGDDVFVGDNSVGCVKMITEKRVVIC